MLAFKSGLELSEDGGIVSYHRPDMTTSSDEKEFVAYARTKQRRSENWGSELFDDLVWKASTIKLFNIFLPMMQLAGGERVLELGAGPAWASVLVKRAHPGCYVVASDLVPASLEFTVNYERLTGVYLDKKLSFNCREIPLEDNQFDRIFTFAAFHHFGDSNDFSKALSEMVRVLKPGGKIFLFYEPSSPKYLYPLVYKQVNRRRIEEGVDEDVIVPSKIKSYEKLLNCAIDISYSPIYQHRDKFLSAMYYFFLSKFRFLQSFTVCTVNVVFEKL